MTAHDTRPEPLTDASFEEWIAHCFDHETAGPTWYHDLDMQEWRAPEALTIRYLTRLFDAPEAALSAYSEAQVDQGLWYMVSNACSDHMFALVEDSVPLAERIACILSIQTLYTEYFAPRCSEHLSHCANATDAVSPLNRICYMFWDLMPLVPVREDPEREAIGNAVMVVLEAALQLPSVACQESALHGLGHWALGYPDEVRVCIEKYISRTRPEGALRDYAEQAAQGNVQ